MPEPSAPDLLEATRRERLELCGFLDMLTPQQWQAASLCPGWTVMDVVAHLTTSTRTGIRDMAVGMIRARGDFDRMEHGRAVALSRTTTPQELVGMLRDTAGSAARAPFTSPVDPLLDVLVHGQDVSRPLGRPRPMAPGRAVPALDHAVASRWYGARERFVGLRLDATDADWAHGDGDRIVSGPVADLLLVATGRPAGLPVLVGSGTTVLADRLAA